MCSWASLTAADSLIVPLQPEDYGARASWISRNRSAWSKSRTNPGLRVLGFLITMHEARKSLHQMYDQRLRAMYGDAVFETRVPRAAHFPEAIANGHHRRRLQAAGAAAKAMKALAGEILGRIEIQTADQLREVA